MKRCLDEGLLQAYMDGELSPGHAGEAAAHIAACRACAESLAEAENESAFFAAALGPDESQSVPSEVLRSRINAAVARLEAKSETNNGRTRGWSFSGFLASLSGLFTFTPQGAVALASLLAVLAFAVIYFASHRQQTPNKVRGGGEIAQGSRGITQPKVTPTPDDAGTAPVTSLENGTGDGSGVKVKYNPGRRPVRKPETPKSNSLPVPKEQFLPGEKEYQTAIASLEKTIKLGGDVTLKPSTRVEYERNIALLDSAINQTRSVAAKNPKDRDAVGFLMSAYQSKVELLTQVAEQAQVAALGR